MKTILVLLIKAYRVVLSPLFGDCCRFYPSCSAYAIKAIETHGCVKGSLMGFWRICRCNPFNLGGVDFVPEARKNK